MPLRFPDPEGESMQRGHIESNPQGILSVRGKKTSAITSAKEWVRRLKDKTEKTKKESRVFPIDETGKVLTIRKG